MAHGRSNAVAMLLGAFLISVRADGHELSIDELRLWAPPQGATLLGQLTFDPELTRVLDEELSEERKRQNVSDFVRAELRLTINGTPCPVDVQVRELYVRGGAVPGDVVMLKCPLGEPLSHVAVTTGSRFAELLVQVSGLRSDEGADSVIIQPGHSASLRVLPSSPAANSASSDVRSQASRLEIPPQRAGAWWSTAWSFVSLGVRHVLPEGVDHVAFVAALSLSHHAAWRRLFVLLAVFTLAHTCAMAWIALGLSAPPATFVEPLIAATIAVAGLSGAFNQLPPSRHTGPTHRGERRNRTAQTSDVSPFLVFAFGLIHGLGFAQALTQLGGDAYFARLVGFNLGVEGAQLACAALVVATLAVVSRYMAVGRAARASSFAIGVFGLIWTVQRLWF